MPRFGPQTERLSLMNRLAVSARDYIRAGINERRYGRLKKSVRFIATERRVIIYSTYYWMRIINDGRKAITKLNGTPMIYYADPLEDPRIALDYPRKPNQRLKISADQFKRDKAAGKIIFARSVDSVPAERFIETGIMLFRKEAPKELRKLVRGRTSKLLRRAKGRSKITVVL